MNTTVTFRHMPSSDSLRDHAERKAQKFMKYLHEPVDIHIVLSIEKIRQIVEINLQSKNYTANAIEESHDMYTSIDKVAAKMEAQIRKHKEKIKEHKLEAKAFEVLDSTIPIAETDV